MATLFSPAWTRFFEGAAAPTPAQPSRFAAPAASAAASQAPYPRPAAAGAAPPARPTPPVGLGRIPSEPTRRKREFTWVTWQMPTSLREAVIFNLRQTLSWRARYCQPLPPPDQPIERKRFGLLGEQLALQGAKTVRAILRAELRETIRTLETAQPLLVRNSWLAMHSARLGQLCAELEQRGLDALEEVRSGLAFLWE